MLVPHRVPGSPGRLLRGWRLGHLLARPPLKNWPSPSFPLGSPANKNGQPPCCAMTDVIVCCGPSKTPSPSPAKSGHPDRVPSVGPHRCQYLLYRNPFAPAFPNVELYSFPTNPALLGSPPGTARRRTWTREQRARHLVCGVEWAAPVRGTRVRVYTVLYSSIRAVRHPHGPPHLRLRDSNFTTQHECATALKAGERATIGPQHRCTSLCCPAAGSCTALHCRRILYTDLRPPDPNRCAPQFSCSEALDE